MKLSPKLYGALRWAAVLAAVVFLVLSFGMDPVSNADPAAVESAVVAKLDVSNMKQGANQMVRRLYGLDPAQYEYCSLYYPATNMDAEELLIIKLKDTAQQEPVRQAVEKRIETQKTTFDGYGIEQYDMLSNNSVVEIRGNYVLFVVSGTSADARQAFLDAL